MKDFIEYIARQLVDEPDSVVVQEEQHEDGRIYVKVTVSQPDIGKIIGKRGRTAFALRTLAAAVGKKSGQRVLLEVIG